MKKLNFGCGKRIKKGWINVDIQKGEGIDKSFDFDVFPYPFKENTFDYVFIDNVLEHLDNIPKVMEELWRICKNNAIIEIRVPYWNHSVAYNDPTHKHYFNIRAFEILCDYEDTYKLEPTKKLELIKAEKIAGNIKGEIFPRWILIFLDKFLHGIFIEINARILVHK